MIRIGKEKTFTGIAKWTGSNTDTQKLDLTFTAPPDKKEKEKCAVVASDLAWPDPDACPPVVYMVQARAAPCEGLSKKQCMARDPKTYEENPAASRPLLPTPECRWVEADKNCIDLSKPTASFARERSDKAARTFKVRPAGSTDGTGLTDEHNAKLNDAAVRSSVQSIESELRRQGN